MPNIKIALLTNNELIDKESELNKEKTALLSKQPEMPYKIFKAKLIRLDEQHQVYIDEIENRSLKN